MAGFWLRQLQAAEAAEEAARRLRRLWGVDAEAHLSEAAIGVETEAAGDARVEDVRRALRWT